MEVDLCGFLKAVHTQTQEDNGAVREHFAVVRLNRDQPEVIMRQVMNMREDGNWLWASGDRYEESGLISRFGDPTAVVDLLRLAAGQSGASVPALLQSLHALQGDDQLVARAISQLEELSA